MKYTLALLFFTLPFLTHEAPVISMPIVGVGSPSLIDVVMLSKAMQGEARGEGTLGMRYVAHVARNRASNAKRSISKEVQTGYCLSRTIKPEIWELAKLAISEPQQHEYTYFFNPKTATDKKFVRWALKQNGVYFGAHYFF